MHLFAENNDNVQYECAECMRAHFAKNNCTIARHRDLCRIESPGVVFGVFFYFVAIINELYKNVSRI